MKRIKHITFILFLISLIVGVGCSGEKKAEDKTTEKKQQTFTCPMHPQIIKHEMGTCPICGMDLVKMPDTNDDGEDETYKLLKRKFIISLAFTIPVFILSMGGMFINFPFSPFTVSKILAS